MKRGFIPVSGYVEIRNDLDPDELHSKLTRFFEEEGLIYLENNIPKVDGLSYCMGQHSAAFFENSFQRKNRYILSSCWGPLGKKVTSLMMNPSYASEAAGDGTVGFMTQYVIEHFNAGAHVVVNMSPYIEPDSGKIRASHFTNDPLNKESIEKAIEWADIVFLAWGDKGGIGAKRNKTWLKPLLIKNQQKLRCFKQSKKGQPIHKNSTKHGITLTSIPSGVDMEILFG